MSPFIVGKQMIILFLIMVIGFVLRKYKIINDKNAKCLSALVVNVFNPALIFSSVLGNVSGDKSMIYKTFLISAFSFLLLILLGILFRRFFSNIILERKIYQLLFVFSNVGFIGIPVVNAMFGSSALIYVAIFILEYNILIYTYGFKLLKEKKEHEKQTIDLKPLINIGTISCIAAIIVFLTQLNIPEIIATPLNYLGNCATPISLIVIGTSIGAQEHLSAIFSDVKLYLFCLVKLIIFPLIGIIIFKHLPIPDLISELTIIMLAMPCGSMTLMLVQQAKLDETACCTGIILSTVFSVATIPFVVLLYNVIP